MNFMFYNIKFNMFTNFMINTNPFKFTPLMTFVAVGWLNNIIIILRPAGSKLDYVSYWIVAR